MKEKEKRVLSNTSKKKAGNAGGYSKGMRPSVCWNKARASGHIPVASFESLLRPTAPSPSPSATAAATLLACSSPSSAIISRSFFQEGPPAGEPVLRPVDERRGQKYTELLNSIWPPPSPPRQPSPSHDTSGSTTWFNI